MRDAVAEGVATRAALAALRADTFRALWMQTSAIVGIVLAAILAAVVALVRLLPQAAP